MLLRTENRANGMRRRPPCVSWFVGKAASSLNGASDEADPLILAITLLTSANKLNLARCWLEDVDNLLRENSDRGSLFYNVVPPEFLYGR